MADNYIERQYEQYEARKAAWEKKRKQGKKKTISVKLQPKDLTDNTIKLPRKAFITGGADGIGRNIVKAFCNSQYQVAFCDKNKDLGIQTAKETNNFIIFTAFCSGHNHWHTLRTRLYT